MVTPEALVEDLWLPAGNPASYLLNSSHHFVERDGGVCAQDRGHMAGEGWRDNEGEEFLSREILSFIGITSWSTVVCVS